MNTWKRKILALASVPLLAVPSAAGVYLWLEPHIGWFFAGLTAAGFESLYIGINVLIITTPDLRRYARNVALSGVATAVIFNTLARYQAMVCPPLPQIAIEAGVISACTLRAVTFDRLALALAVLESIPLAGLAYAISVLLHRLSEERTWSRRPAQLRALVKRLARQVRTARDEIARLSLDLAQISQTAAHADADAARAIERSAQLEGETARIQSEAAEQVRTAAEVLRERDERIARLEAELAQPLAIDGIDLLRIARRLCELGEPTRDTAELLGMKDSTLRSRMEKAASNGHLKETI